MNLLLTAESAVVKWGNTAVDSESGCGGVGMLMYACCGYPVCSSCVVWEMVLLPPLT